MKNGKNPTSAQKKALSRNGLDPAAYLYVGAVGQGWLFRERNDAPKTIAVYSCEDGVFEADGVTPAGES